jgi:hypothetical protein
MGMKCNFCYQIFSKIGPANWNCGALRQQSRQSTAEHTTRTNPRPDLSLACMLARTGQARPSYRFHTTNLLDLSRSVSFPPILEQLWLGFRHASLPFRLKILGRTAPQSGKEKHLSSSSSSNVISL